VKHRQKVLDVARALNLLNSNEALVRLDSLSIVDFVDQLERATGISIPMSDMLPHHFESIESVSTLLTSLEK